MDCVLAGEFMPNTFAVKTYEDNFVKDFDYAKIVHFKWWLLQSI